MQSLSNMFQVWQYLSVRVSQSSWFKALYERSNEQSLSQSTLRLSYYQKIFGKNAILRHLVKTIDKCLQLDFFKVLALRVYVQLLYIDPQKLAKMQCLSKLFQV